MKKQQIPYIRGVPFIGVIVTMVLIFIGLVAGGDTVEAANVFSAPRIKVASDAGVTMDAKYTFVPKFGSNSRMVTFGSGWRDINFKSTDSTKFRANDIGANSGLDSRKGQIGATYTNIGYYKGQSLDLKITVNNWSRYGTSGLRYGDNATIANISFQSNRIAFSSQGFNWVDMTWTFVKSGTSTKVPVSGYFTFSDIDVGQTLEFSKSTSDNIDNYIVENRNNKLQYSSSSGKHKFYDRTDRDVDDKKFNHEHALTILYSDVYSLQFRWGTDFGFTTRLGKAFSPGRYFWPLNYADGEYMFYELNKPLPTQISVPKKTVSKTAGIKAGDTLTYDVDHVVPTEPSEFYYSSYEFRDRVSDVLSSISNVKVLDSSGKDVTGQFTISKDGTLLKASAKAATLTSAGFYGKEYTFRITGKVDANLLRSKIGSNTSYNINNEGFVRINGKDYKSNTVTSKVDKRTITINHVDDDTGAQLASETKTVFDGEAYSYNPRTDLKTDKGHNYKAVTGKLTGTVSGNLTLTFRYQKPREIKIEHVDADTKKVITSSTEYKYKGDAYSYSPRTDLKTSEGTTYRPLSTVQSGTVANNMTITMEYQPPRVITINHVDDDTGALIKSETDKKHIGDSFTYSPKTDLKTSGGDAYKAVTGVQTGTIAGNTVITFRYTKPRTITIKHVDDDDNKVLKTETEKKYDGEKYSYAPKTDLKTSAGDAYKAVTPTQTGTVKGDVTVTIRYTKPRTITINHVDDDDNKVLKTETDKKYDGEQYSYTPRTDLKTSAGDAYKAVSTTQTGTVNGNTTVTIRYTKPRLITIKHVDDDDDKVLRTDTDKKYDGETYKYTPRTDLKNDKGHLYRSLVKEATGTVKGNMTVTIRYEKPRTITIKHIDKNTNAVLATDIDYKYRNDAYAYKARTDLKNKNGDAYRVWEAAELKGTVKENMTLTFKYHDPHLLNIYHKDVDTNKLIATQTNLPKNPEVIKLYEGEKYTYATNQKLTFEFKGKTYKYFKTEGGYTQQYTTTMGNKDIDVTLEYQRPRVDIGLDKVQIKTEKSDKGLTANVFFKIDEIVAGWQTETTPHPYEIRVVLLDKKNNSAVVYNQTMTIKSIIQNQNKLDIPIPNSITKNISKTTLNQDFEVKLSKVVYEPLSDNILMDKRIELDNLRANVQLPGYIASEKTLTAEQANDAGLVKYSGVAMTERPAGRDNGSPYPVKLYKEYLEMNVNPDINIISGYGYEHGHVLTYGTEVASDALPTVEKINATVLADKEIADGNYSTTQGKHDIGLTSTVKDTTTSGRRSRAVTYSPTNMYLDQSTGQLSTESKSGYTDAGKKVYVPVWLDALGRYSIQTTTDIIGRNAIKFNIERNVNVDAYMFGHVDSETYDKDALLIQPKIVGEDPFEGR